MSGWSWFIPYWDRPGWRRTKHNPLGQGGQRHKGRARGHSTRGQGEVTWSIVCHSLLFPVLSLPTPIAVHNESQLGQVCELPSDTTWGTKVCVFPSSVWFIPGQNSKCLPSARRILDLISHKPECVCSVTTFISFQLNLIPTLNPQFQLIEDNLIESLQVNTIKLAITQLFLF